MRITEQMREDVRRQLARIGMKADDATVDQIIREGFAEREFEARVS